MPMPKKGARTIVVGGTAYRWSVVGQSADPHVRLYVERSNGAASRLVALVAHGLEPPAADALIGPVPIATPALVRRAVEVGLAAGWRPDLAGPPVTVTLADAAELLVRGHEWL